MRWTDPRRTWEARRMPNKIRDMVLAPVLFVAALVVVLTHKEGRKRPEPPPFVDPHRPGGNAR